MRPASDLAQTLDCEDEQVELDTWSEEDDGVEDPFEMEDEEPADESFDERRQTDEFDTSALELPQPARARSNPDLPRIKASSLHIVKFFR